MPNQLTNVIVNDSPVSKTGADSDAGSKLGTRMYYEEAEIPLVFRNSSSTGETFDGTAFVTKNGRQVTLTLPHVARAFSVSGIYEIAVDPVTGKSQIDDRFYPSCSADGGSIAAQGACFLINTNVGGSTDEYGEIRFKKSGAVSISRGVNATPFPIGNANLYSTTFTWNATSAFNKEYV